MQKHLLITISEDIRMLHGVRFVSSFFNGKSDIEVTLLYVSPRAETPGGDKVQREIDKKNTEIYRQKGEISMGVARKILCERGFPEANISSQLMFKQFGTVKDIVRQAQARWYDAVVLGKRGYIVLQSFMQESVTKEILERDIDFPIWICKQPEEARKNVLLCVDGSEPSLRMADHVGFMLSTETEHQVTLFHADTGERNVPELIEQAKAKLLENGVEEARIDYLVTSSSSSAMAKAVLNEVERRRYAVVAVGRVGVKKGLMNRWLVGSLSTKLSEELEKAVLWVSK